MTATVTTTAPLTGELIIAGSTVPGTGTTVHGIDPSTGADLEPAYRHGTMADVDAACAAADEAFDAYRSTTSEARANFLDAIADNIEALGETLIERAVAESGLPVGRITGEVGRTSGQLRLFASVLREGSWNGARIDPAQPDRAPLPRADIRQRTVSLGPVVVFGASNFPLAFSVGGGDTASALAAGCPVIVKAHDAHPVRPSTSAARSPRPPRRPACRQECSRSSTATAAPSAPLWSPTRASRPSASLDPVPAAPLWYAPQPVDRNRSRCTPR